MKKTIILATVLALGMSVGSAEARTTVEPKKANKIQATMVRSYDLCPVGSITTTTTGALALPACSPSVTSDSTCTLEAGKAGAKISAKEKKGDVEIQFKVTKLQGCEAEELCGFADARVTGDGCVDGNPEGCTVYDALTEFGGLNGENGFETTICCTVDSKGNCQAKTTLGAALGFTFTPGATTSISVGRITLKRTGGGTVLTSGLLVP